MENQTQAKDGGRVKMLLLTLHQYIGPKTHCTQEIRDRIQRIESIVGMVTELPLREALSRIHSYELDFTVRHEYMACEYHLHSVSVIDDLDSDAIQWGRLEKIEDLHHA